MSLVSVVRIELDAGQAERRFSPGGELGGGVTDSRVLGKDDKIDGITIEVNRRRKRTRFSSR